LLTVFALEIPIKEQCGHYSCCI